MYAIGRNTVRSKPAVNSISSTRSFAKWCGIASICGCSTE